MVETWINIEDGTEVTDSIVYHELYIMERSYNDLEYALIDDFSEGDKEI